MAEDTSVPRGSDANRPIYAMRLVRPAPDAATREALMAALDRIAEVAAEMPAMRARTDALLAEAAAIFARLESK